MAKGAHVARRQQTTQKVNPLFQPQRNQLIEKIIICQKQAPLLTPLAIYAVLCNLTLATLHTFCHPQMGSSFHFPLPLLPIIMAWTPCSPPRRIALKLLSFAFKLSSWQASSLLFPYSTTPCVQFHL